MQDQDDSHKAACLCSQIGGSVCQQIGILVGAEMPEESVDCQIRDICQTCQLIKGTPQEGILSPVVWNMAFEALLAKFASGPTGQICIRPY